MKFGRFNFLIVCAFLSAILLNSPNSFGWQSNDDRNGTHGVDGDPATSGTDGRSGENRLHVRDGQSSFDEFGGQFFFNVFGFAGGHGGDGGQGLDGDDEDRSAQGGNGGNGGNGGLAQAVWLNLPANNRNSPFGPRSYGGQGGNGGDRGLGSSQDLDGRGGNGGHGGLAYVHTSTFVGSITLEANGGDGGWGVGVGQSGGNGGFTYAFAASTETETHNLILVERGGHGGYGYRGADGGDGASVIFGHDPSRFQVDFESDHPAFETSGHISSIGGNGGQSIDGVAGQAGNAIAHVGNAMSNWFAPESVPVRRSHHTLSATGGSGGNGYSTNNRAIAGARGGYAAHRFNGTTIGFGDQLTLNLDAYGGQGGDALGATNTGTAGRGGGASFDDVHFKTNSSGIQELDLVQFNATLNGGNGGDSEGAGAAGHGASVGKYNGLTVEGSNGTVQISIRARAGQGGTGLVNGNGGNALVAIENAIVDESRLTRSREISLTARATGGNAGLLKNGLNTADGGHAWSSIVQHSRSSLRANSYSLGGRGQNGRSGDAFAQVDVSTDNEFEHPFTAGNGRVRASAFASRTQDFENIRFEPTYGTNATAIAKATSQGADTNAAATAKAGWGSVSSGNALAVATARNEGTQGTTRSTATSEVLGDNGAEPDNSSKAVANTFSMVQSDDLTTVSATAQARSVAHRALNQARATLDGFQGEASAFASSSSVAWNHLSAVRQETEYRANNDSTHRIDTVSTSGFRRPDFGDLDGVEARATYAVVPERGLSDSILGATHLKEKFVDDASADILGVGEFGASLDDGSMATLNVRGTMDMTLRLQPEFDDEFLMFGLFGTAEGSGFEALTLSAALDSRDPFLDEKFTSADDALAYFDGRIFELMDLQGMEEQISLSLEFEYTIDESTGSFDFGFALANAAPGFDGSFSFSTVPEPASGLVMASCLLGFLLRRRRVT